MKVPAASTKRDRVKVPAAVVIFLLVGVVSWLGREGHHGRVPDPARNTWISLSVDTNYHCRRVDRTLTEGLPPAGEDSFLNFPEGSPIPWPPYYTLVGWAATAPFLPADLEEAPDPADARRAFVERRVASLPRVFGVVTSLVTAAAGWMVAGPAGAALAGGNHALAIGSLFYSFSGNGDHHAWISLLALGTLFALSAGIRRGALDRAGPALRWGALAGAIAGLAVGSWVGSTLHVIAIQLALGYLVIRHGRRPSPGLPALGLAFHGVAFLVVLPAILQSPWNVAQPWSVVNLSWFHGAWLLAGAAVFVPLRGLPRRAARVYPLFVAAALVGAGALLAFGDLPLGQNLREGFRWMERQDAFMGSVWESRAVGPYEMTFLHGWGVVLFPFAWAWAAWLTFRRDRVDLLPWVVAIALLAVEGAQQYRFHEPLVAPLSVCLAWFVVTTFRIDDVSARVARFLPDRRGRLVAAGAAIAILLPLAHQLSVRDSWRGLRQPPPVDRLSREVRSLAAWIRTNTPPTDDYSVLTSWNWGHVVEWAAERPSVGTNFGIFVGEESFRDPGRFLLEEDPAAAEAILQRRRSRYVLLTGWFPKFLEQTALSVDPELLTRYANRTATGEWAVRFEWFRTMGARLLFDGSAMDEAGVAGAPLDFLRLVAVSPRSYPEPLLNRERPAGYVWEYVPGARLEAHGSPGDRLQVEIRLRFAALADPISWWGEAVAGDDGVARLRIPYSTDTSNGDGQPLAPLRWRFRGGLGNQTIPERAVLRGETILVGAAE